MIPAEDFLEEEEYEMLLLEAMGKGKGSNQIPVMLVNTVKQNWKFPEKWN